jgi:alcohol dehydrogenase
VGGGSVMDVAKAGSVLTANPKPAREYAGMGKIQRPGTPLILAPSTAGSGSEVTPFAVFIDSEQKRKLGLNSEMYLPRLTVVDPDLTLSCPPSVALSSGMDALTHALESFAARKHTVFSRILSREAFARVYKNLPLALARPDDPAPRRELSLGAYLAGAALLNSSGGPAGVLSYPIGTLFGAPHGLAGAIFLQPVAAFNVRGGYTDYCELYDLAAPSPSGGDRAERAERFVEDLDRFCREVGVPRSLEDFGVDQDSPPLIMEHLSALWAAVELNPVDMTAEDVEEILRALLKQRP